MSEVITGKYKEKPGRSITMSPGSRPKPSLPMTGQSRPAATMTSPKMMSVRDISDLSVRGAHAQAELADGLNRMSRSLSSRTHSRDPMAPGPRRAAPSRSRRSGQLSPGLCTVRCAAIHSRSGQSCAAAPVRDRPTTPRTLIDPCPRASWRRRRRSCRQTARSRFCSGSHGNRTVASHNG